MSETKPDFEESLVSLEQTVARLESGECSLEESIDLFETGMEKIKLCRLALEHAEKKIVTLSQAEKENADV